MTGETIFQYGVNDPGLGDSSSYSRGVFGRNGYRRMGMIKREWIDSLSDEQQRRLAQILIYDDVYGYSEDSDGRLVWLLVQMLDTKVWMQQKRLTND